MDRYWARRGKLFVAPSISDQHLNSAYAQDWQLNDNNKRFLGLSKAQKRKKLKKKRQREKAKIRAEKEKLKTQMDKVEGYNKPDWIRELTCSYYGMIEGAFVFGVFFSLPASSQVFSQSFFLCILHFINNQRLISG